MAPTYRPATTQPKNEKMRQFFLIVGFSLLLLVIIPLYKTALNPFHYLLSPLCPYPSSSGTPFSPPPPPPPQQQQERSVDTVMEEEEEEEKKKEKSCDVFVGDWVPVDPNEALYYTNASCSMIQENRNCLLSGRPNTEFLNWRWQPADGCQLPRVEPRRFLEMMRGKSMAFVGDSLSKNHMQSLICVLSSVDYPRDVSPTSDDDFKVMFYENYNFKVSVFWSPFLVKTTLPPNRNLNGLWTINLDVPDEYWVSDIAGFDYVVISNGNWFMKRALLYDDEQLVGCSSCSIRDLSDLGAYYLNKRAFGTAFAALNAMEGFKGKVIMRTLSPDHFEGGDWENGGDCPETRPYGKDEVSLNKHVRKLYEGQVEEFRTAAEEGRRRGLEYKLIDITQAMLLRRDGHPSRYSHSLRQPNATHRNDCVHWCLPGPIDVWNEFLYHAMINL